MTNVYRFQCRAVCPIHAELIDVYDVEVRASVTIPVERILEVFAPYEKRQIFQEFMTQEAAVALGASVSTTGIHSGVEVISYAP